MMIVLVGRVVVMILVSVMVFGVVFWDLVLIVVCLVVRLWVGWVVLGSSGRRVLVIVVVFLVRLMVVVRFLLCCFGEMLMWIMVLCVLSCGV